MKRATIRTTHDDPVDAARIADAVRPDNTDEMETAVDGSTIATTIERGTTGGLQATADDYVVNLQVAAQLAGQNAKADDHTADDKDNHTTDTP